MKNWLLLPGLMMFLLLAASCSSPPHFGVTSRAWLVPDEFGQTESVIAQAEQSPGAKYCPEKIARAKELGRQAAETYWACHTDEAMKLLGEARQLAKESEGCQPPPPVAQPEPAPAPAPPQPEKVCISLNVQFDFDRAEVKAKYHDVIGSVAEFMKKHPTTTAVIEGNTDNLGKHSYNMKLSQRRAESVKNYLIEKFGIESSRLSTKGYGETKPVATNKTAAGRQKNRRIDAIIDCAAQ